MADVVTKQEAIDIVESDSEGEDEEKESMPISKPPFKGQGGLPPSKQAAVGGPYKNKIDPGDAEWRKKLKVKNAKPLGLPICLDPNIVEASLDLTNERARTWRIMRTKRLQEAYHRDPEKYQQWQDRVGSFYRKAIWGKTPSDGSAPKGKNNHSIFDKEKASAALPSTTLWHYYYFGGKTRAERRQENLKRIDLMRKEQEEKMKGRIKEHKARLSAFARKGMERREKLQEWKKTRPKSPQVDLEVALDPEDLELESKAKEEAAIMIQSQIRGCQVRIKNAGSQSKIQSEAIENESKVEQNESLANEPDTNQKRAKQTSSSSLQSNQGSFKKQNSSSSLKKQGSSSSSSKLSGSFKESPAKQESFKKRESFKKQGSTASVEKQGSFKGQGSFQKQNSSAHLVDQKQAKAEVNDQGAISSVEKQGSFKEQGSFKKQNSSANLVDKKQVEVDKPGTISKKEKPTEEKVVPGPPPPSNHDHNTTPPDQLESTKQTPPGPPARKIENPKTPPQHQLQQEKEQQEKTIPPPQPQLKTEAKQIPPQPQLKTETKPIPPQPQLKTEAKKIPPQPQMNPPGPPLKKVIPPQPQMNKVPGPPPPKT